MLALVYLHAQSTVRRREGRLTVADTLDCDLLSGRLRDLHALREVNDELFVTVLCPLGRRALSLERFLDDDVDVGWV